jgi:hypothetical protein
MSEVAVGKLTSDAIEVVNRNALVTVALSLGYNVYLPVYDNGIDLILHHEGTADTRLVQLKGRWTIDKKYIGRNVWIAFPDRDEWYVAPHEHMVCMASRHHETVSWTVTGLYNKPSLSKADRDELARFKFGSAEAVMGAVSAQS